MPLNRFDEEEFQAAAHEFAFRVRGVNPKYLPEAEEGAESPVRDLSQLAEAGGNLAVRPQVVESGAEQSSYWDVPEPVNGGLVPNYWPE